MSKAQDYDIEVLQPGMTASFTNTVTVWGVFIKKKRDILDAVCTVGGKVVLEGASTMLCTSSKS